MKKTLTVLLFLCCTTLFAQTRINSDYSTAYRQALMCFDNKDYGNALKYAEDAIRYKKDNLTKEVNKLERSLTTREVKAAGDDIEKVKNALKSRDEYDIVEIIDYYIHKKGIAYFNNSIKSLISYIKTQEQYPEAQKLIGDIYKLEGEYSLAENFYKKALDFSEVLDINDEKYSILYLMADLSRLSGDKNTYEVRLLNITSTETLEKRNMLIKSMSSLIKKDNKGTLDKFFNMYRFQDYYSLNAYCQLAQFYKDEGELEKALQFSALAVITGFSKMDYVISKRDLTYEYKDIKSFLENIVNYNDLVEWGDSNNIWKSFDLLCELSNLNGAKTFSTDLLKVLARYSPSEYWQHAAVIKLDSMN
ncbi:MAG: hypothetical protein MJ179_10145 [Treponema sp.]|nr:hypothetical protein [Treponema sp.]